MKATILVGDVMRRLRELPDCSVQCVVTSPPYWGLRDYKIEPQVWGGDAGCVHEWGMEQVDREMRHGLGLKDSPANTRGAVSLRYARNFIGIELNPEYAQLAQKRIGAEAPMFNEVEVCASCEARPPSSSPLLPAAD